MQLSHIQLHEKKVTELLDKELKELKSLQGRLAYIRSFLISQEDANRSPGRKWNLFYVQDLPLSHLSKLDI